MPVEPSPAEKALAGLVSSIVLAFALAFVLLGGVWLGEKVFKGLGVVAGAVAIVSIWISNVIYDPPPLTKILKRLNAWMLDMTKSPHK